MAHPFGVLPPRFEPVDGRSRGVAFVLPGRSYSPSAPLLEFARQALLQHGWTVHQVWWDAPDYDEDDDEARWVGDQLAAAVAAETQAYGAPAEVLVVAKSLGTLATPYVARQGWPAIWLTPLLDDAPLVAGLRANPARQLLVGGLQDPYWVEDVAADLAAVANCDTVEVPDADHTMWVPGDAVRGAEIQLEVARATHAFLEDL